MTWTVETRVADKMHLFFLGGGWCIWSPRDWLFMEGRPRIGTKQRCLQDKALAWCKDRNSALSPSP